MNFRREGDLAFQPEEKEPSSESSTEETTTVTEKPGEPEKPMPFNEDPQVQEYIERQVAKRVDGIEEKIRTETKGNIAAIREEFGKAREKNAEQTKIPAWFGGGQQQWDDFRSWNEAQLKDAEERAVNRTFEKASETTGAEKKRVDEATAYMQSELKVITADKALNPSGKAVDPQALLKIVLDNDLVDSQGRWNYRAGMRLMSSHATATHAPKGDQEKKKLAGATVDGDKGAGAGGGAPKTYKTAADFKKKRPW